MHNCNLQICLTLLLASLFSLSSCTTSYDYYVYASEWAGSVCSTNKCSNISSINRSWFNIHGLWPNSNDGNHPAFCQNSSVFALSKLSPSTIAEVYQFWNGMYSSTEEFLFHEWSKHGTCWNDDLEGDAKMEAYVETAIEVGQSLEVYQVLERNGIVPGNNYPLNEVQDALNQAFVNPKIECKNGYLLQISICLDLEYNIIECPAWGSNCPETVSYPTLNCM